MGVCSATAAMNAASAWGGRSGILTVNGANSPASAEDDKLLPSRGTQSGKCKL